MNVAPKVKDHQKPCVFDFLFSYGQVSHAIIKKTENLKRIHAIMKKHPQNKKKYRDGTSFFCWGL